MLQEIEKYGNREAVTSNTDLVVRRGLENEVKGVIPRDHAQV